MGANRLSPRTTLTCQHFVAEAVQGEGDRVPDARRDRPALLCPAGGMAAVVVFAGGVPLREESIAEYTRTAHFIPMTRLRIGENLC